MDTGKEGHEPDVQRGGAQFEEKSDKHERQRDTVGTCECAEEEARGTRFEVEEAHPVEEDACGERAEHEVFETGLEGEASARACTEQGAKDEEAEVLRFQTDEKRNEIDGMDEEGIGHEGEHKEEVGFKIGKGTHDDTRKDGHQHFKGDDGREEIAFSQTKHHEEGNQACKQESVGQMQVDVT